MSVRRLSMMVSAAALVVATAVPASASASVGYDGTFADHVSYVGCKPEVSGTLIASGTWRVNLHDQKATARFVINVDGAPHVAFTAQMARVDDSEATFKATLSTGAGPLEVKLVGDHFTYTISPYDYAPWGGPTCSSVTYSGTLNP